MNQTSIEQRAAAIELAVFDLDGVFTDGRLYFSARGEAMKAFHVHDGYGVRRLLEAGIEVAVITGRSSRAATLRFRELGVRHLYQACTEKLERYHALLAELGLRPEQSSCMGDDLPDLEMLQAAGLGVAVSDAHPAILAAADWCTSRAGGRGAVRELADLLLAAREAG